METKYATMRTIRKLPRSVVEKLWYKGAIAAVIHDGIMYRPNQSNIERAYAKAYGYRRGSDGCIENAAGVFAAVSWLDFASEFHFAIKAYALAQAVVEEVTQ